MKKALKIIGISLLACCLVATIVLYAIFPTQTKDVLTNIWATLNTPLPIVGVTTVAVLVFIWQIVIRTNYGKKALANIKEEYQAKYDQLKAEKDALEKEREENKEQIEDMKKCIIELCALIPNKKVNDLGDKFAKGLDYGETKETTNSETKAD